jgi:hypothetical protein
MEPVAVCLDFKPAYGPANTTARHMETDQLDESTHLPQTPTRHSEACNLLLLQEYVQNVSRAQQILEHTSASLQRTEILTGIFSEQDLRTLRTACQCLNSLRIRIEARPTQWSLQLSNSSCSLCKQVCSQFLPMTSIQRTRAPFQNLFRSFYVTRLSLLANPASTLSSQLHRCLDCIGHILEAIRCPFLSTHSLYSPSSATTHFPM